MTPEEQARQTIDKMLEETGWAVQDYKNINLGVSKGIAVREYPLNTGSADYLLIINRKAIGVLEAKPYGTTLRGVDSQSDKYQKGYPEDMPYYSIPLPFAYESTGKETFFRDIRDPDYRSRKVFTFHTPSQLEDCVREEETLRARLRAMPELNTEGLRACQVEAIRNLEGSFYENRPRALIQMATGSGKTFTAVSFCYRLIKYAKAKRILFLVDRRNLGKQTKKEFEQYFTPDDGRKFTELYNIQHMTSNVMDDVSKVTICTIQRLYSILLGEKEFDSELDEKSIYELDPKDIDEREIRYNPKIPIDYFDFIITDECHRSIYSLWRQVLEYFDAFIIGLTATPSKQTFGFFNQNLVMEYSHERAVADRVNVDYEVYKIETRITDSGGRIDKGFIVDKRDRYTREVRWERLDEELEYTAQELDRSVVVPDQIRTIIKAFKNSLPEMFEGRSEAPKTLVFCKDDSHAEDVTQIIREVFGRGNEFCTKITYRSQSPDELIKTFRNSYYPRIAVTVDMVSTGVDIKPLECLLFMRSVKSKVLFEQMKGRGTRTILPNDLRAVTNDAMFKDKFVIVDAVGVTENDLTDSRPLERKKTVSFEELIMSIAKGKRDEDSLLSLASRLARLDKKITDEERAEIRELSNGKSLQNMVNSLLDSADPDVISEKAMKLFQTDIPSEDDLRAAKDELIDFACQPFDVPELRNRLFEIKKRTEMYIDTENKDEIISTGFSKEEASSVIQTFKKYIDEHKDEITAFQIIYSKPYSQRHLTFEATKALAKNINMPPYNLTPERLWAAYERVGSSKVKRASPHRLLTDIVCLVRFAIGEVDVLEPYEETVEKRFGQWLDEQENDGRKFSPEQREWLEMIKNHISSSLNIEIEDFELTPFNEKGGAIKAYEVLGEDFNDILEELNEVLVK